MSSVRSSLLVLALSLAMSPTALARQGTPCSSVISQLDSVPPMTTGWTEDVTFDKFDPDLGTLTDVSVTLTATIEGQAQFESLTNKSANITMTFSATLAVYRPGGTDVITSVVPQQQFMQTVPGFDGVIDFGGTSGMSFPGLSIVRSRTHTSPSPLSDLALFTGVGGAGPAGTITLPVVANGTSTGSGAGSIIFQFMQEASVEVEVRYFYTTDVVCDYDSVLARPTSWADSVTVDKFDPDLGVLTDVVVTLTGTITGQAGYESPDPSPNIVTLTFSADFELYRPGGTSLITSVSPQEQFIDNASAFDGIIDLDGTSGETYLGISATSARTHTSPPPISDLLLFTGTPGAGSPGTITLPITAVATTTISGAGGLIIVYTQEASATVSVSYLYDEDCNQNGMSDVQDIQNGIATDCNLNGVPDDCDLTFGTSPDANGDGVPDECNAGISLCNGDGGDGLGCTDCPCSNNAPIGTVGGCLNSLASSARLEATGDSSASLAPGLTTDLRFALFGAPPFAFCILGSGDTVEPQSMSNPCFGLQSGLQSAAFDGLRCAIMNTRRHGGRKADTNGNVGHTNSPWGGEANPLAGIAQAGGGFVAGQTRYFQVINRDDPLLSCMRGLNTSQAIGITFAP